MAPRPQGLKGRERLRKYFLICSEHGKLLNRNYGIWNKCTIHRILENSSRVSRALESVEDLNSWLDKHFLDINIYKHILNTTKSIRVQQVSHEREGHALPTGIVPNRYLPSYINGNCCSVMAEETFFYFYKERTCDCLVCGAGIVVGR